VARTYTLKKRAERQTETRRRILDAAVALHAEVGPARATVSAIAAAAGVERHTYYRHFPEERDLFTGCTRLYLERNPLPDPAEWRESRDPRKRIRRGLEAMYSYYEKNEGMLVHVARDAEDHPLTREMFERHIAPKIGAIAVALAETLPGARRLATKAALDLALDFGTWRLLVRRSGLSTKRAAELIATMVLCAD
jgi:AcrR family transcriptional regulator